MIMSACVKPVEDKDIQFSVLGDSFSAYEGYVDPDSNDVWYCNPPNNNINVTSVEDMWWYKVSVETG